MQNFYQLLSIDATATRDEIKRAFRSEIARYHPDKVQHLAKEFQEMAASRAAALTEAYRTLMDAELRAEYDRMHVGAASAAPPAVPPSPGHSPHPAAPQQPQAPEPPRSGPADCTPDPRFASELRDRDSLLRSATLDRFRMVLAAELGAMNELPPRRFDLDVEVTAKKLFSRTGGHRYAVKLVQIVDKLSVQDAWSTALKLSVPICVFLMGSRLAPAKELADVISELRKRNHTRTGISIIPVDVRDWSAYMPADAPSSCRNVLRRLRELSSV